MCNIIRKILYKFFAPFLTAFSAFLLALPTLCQQCCNYSIFCLASNALKITYFVVTLAVLMLVVIISFFPVYRYRKIELLNKQDEFSRITFNALQAANRKKVQEVLRYTYGQVAVWDNINYFRNVLTYDIHEQIRYILITLRDLIVQSSDENMFSSDSVTVDLIYSYGDFNTRDLTERDNNRIRLISSGDVDYPTGIKRYLYNNRESFFSLIDEVGFYFKNDKNQICYSTNGISRKNYIPSQKDLVYNNLEATSCSKKRKKDADGSIVGMVFYLKNDEPESVLIKAMLTITTYGHKIYYGNDFKEFARSFYDNVLCSYKSVLLSELSQMYIRHEIKTGRINPVTGKKIKIEGYDSCVCEKSKAEYILKDQYLATMRSVDSIVKKQMKNIVIEKQGYEAKAYIDLSISESKLIKGAAKRKKHRSPISPIGKQ